LRAEVPVIAGSQRIDDEWEIANSEHFAASEPIALVGIEVGVEVGGADDEDDAVGRQRCLWEFAVPSEEDRLEERRQEITGDGVGVPRRRDAPVELGSDGIESGKFSEGHFSGVVLFGVVLCAGVCVGGRTDR
jgi:hypothetical protein